MLSRLIVPGILVVLAIVFIAENRQKVRIRIIGPVVEMPIWMAFTVLLLIGGVAGYFFARRRARQK